MAAGPPLPQRMQDRLFDSLISVRDGRGRYELHDLLTGARVRSEVVDTRSESGRWSPDGRAFLPALQVIDTATGTVRPLPAPVAIVAGLLDPDRVVTLQVDRSGGTATTVVNIAGNPLRLVRNGTTSPSITLSGTTAGYRYNIGNDIALDDTVIECRI